MGNEIEQYNTKTATLTFLHNQWKHGSTKETKFDERDMDYFNKDQFSDLTLVCGDKIYKVYKVILCSKSTFFYDASTKEPKSEPDKAHGKEVDEVMAEFNDIPSTQLRHNTQAVLRPSDRKEPKVISLEEENIMALEAMLSFFYRQDYEYPSEANTAYEKGHFDVAINALADKYEAADLIRSIFSSNNKALKDLMIDKLILKVDNHVSESAVTPFIEQLTREWSEFTHLLATRSITDFKALRDRANDLTVKLKKAEQLAEEGKPSTDEFTCTCKECLSEFVVQTGEYDKKVYCPYCGTKHRLFQRSSSPEYQPRRVCASGCKMMISGDSHPESKLVFKSKWGYRKRSSNDGKRLRVADYAPPRKLI